jgi:hypothetical protein
MNVQLKTLEDGLLLWNKSSICTAQPRLSSSLARLLRGYVLPELGFSREQLRHHFDLCLSTIAITDFIDNGASMVDLFNDTEKYRVKETTLIYYRSVLIRFLDFLRSSLSQMEAEGSFSSFIAQVGDDNTASVIPSQEIKEQGEGGIILGKGIKDTGEGRERGNSLLSAFSRVEEMRKEGFLKDSNYDVVESFNINSVSGSMNVNDTGENVSPVAHSLSVTDTGQNISQVSPQESDVLESGQFSSDNGGAGIILSKEIKDTGEDREKGKQKKEESFLKYSNYDLAKPEEDDRQQRFTLVMTLLSINLVWI